MKTSQAIVQVLTGKDAPSKYALPKALDVRPIMIDHYLNGSRMKQKNADKFESLFGIKLSDVYSPTSDAMERRKDEPNT